MDGRVVKRVIGGRDKGEEVEKVAAAKLNQLLLGAVRKLTHLEWTRTRLARVPPFL